MDLIYYKDRHGNFGDDLNEWIWDDLLPGWKTWDSSVSLVGVGTLLNATRLDPLRNQKLLIVGSGAGYGTIPKLPLPSNWDVRSVRGPQSARLLGLPKNAGLLDPAVMIPELSEFCRLSTTGLPIFIPHHTSLGRHDWDVICKTAGIDFVSPRENAKEVIQRIGAAPLVLAESMHAAILADSFRVPWIPVRISPWFNADKWSDWAESLDLKFTITSFFPQLDAIAQFLRKRRPVRGSGGNKSGTNDEHVLKSQYRKSARLQLESLMVSRRMRNILNQKPYLSDSATLASKKAGYNEVLESIRLDYGGSST